MMRRTFTFAAACLLAFAPASLAWSQQEPGGAPARPQTQPRSDAAAQETEARPRAAAQQPGTQQPGARQPVRPLQAAREGAVAERGVSQLATLLALGNQMEIELGKLAAEKSSHEDVRAFANKMVEEHTANQQKLEPFNPQLAAGDRNRQRLEAAGERLQAAGERQRAARAERQPSAAGRPSENGEQPRGLARGQAGQVALLPILRDAAQRNLRMTKEMLSNYEGQDFDMGYLGQQVVAHTEMLAKLEAMQGKGTPEFQQVVDQGVEATKEHLEAAKSLARQLADKERGGSGAQPASGARQPQPN